MQMRPISPVALIAQIADRVVAVSQHTLARRARVGIDGADAARPGEFADALIDPLRVRGRAVFRVRTEDHLRPASLRYEQGRYEADSFLDGWLDADGLRREVLDPMGRPGPVRIRPSRWDCVRDRASRAGFVPVPEGGVVIVSGALLLGRGLAFELSVHLDLSTGALARRTPPELEWTLPAYARYAAEVSPRAVADIVVRIDDPAHPAVST